MSRVIQPEGEVFGRRLRDIRAKQGMTQQSLAEVAGMSEAYISNMEHGLKVPEPHDDPPPGCRSRLQR